TRALTPFCACAHFEEARALILVGRANSSSQFTPIKSGLLSHLLLAPIGGCRPGDRGSPVVTADETGWRVNVHLEWLWAYATPETTVYAFNPGEGFTRRPLSSVWTSPLP